MSSRDRQWFIPTLKNINNLEVIVGFWDFIDYVLKKTLALHSHTASYAEYWAEICDRPEREFIPDILIRTRLRSYLHSEHRPSLSTQLLEA